MRATVVIPCYKPDHNFEKMLGDLNAQTSTEFNVLFADDGNTPPLEPRIKRGLSRPYRVIRFEQNKGIVEGLNACVAAADTDYIIRMDADDRMAPDRIERQLTFMDRKPQVDVAGSSMVVFGSGLRLWSKPLQAEDVKASLLWGPCLHHPTVIAKTAVLQSNPYPTGFALAEDYALWLRLAQKGVCMENSLDVHVYYRMEGQNTSQEGVDKRANRYLIMFKHALTSLLPIEENDALMDFVNQGCHHVFAGMPLPPGVNPPPSALLLEYANALARGLKSINEPWAKVALHDLNKRRARVNSTNRWYKLTPILALSRLRLRDWRLILDAQR